MAIQNYLVKSTDESIIMHFEKVFTQGTTVMENHITCYPQTFKSDKRYGLNAFQTVYSLVKNSLLK